MVSTPCQLLRGVFIAGKTSSHKSSATPRSALLGTALLLIFIRASSGAVDCDFRTPRGPEGASNVAASNG
ncbi:hypothetical protein D3C79_525300 [compost metagenome]